MPEETITLRDAARRLAKAKNAKQKKIQSSQLLNVLRSGELKAGFYFLDGAQWIAISVSYWQALGSDRFRRLGRKVDDPTSGTYKIRANTFPDQLADLICKTVDANAETTQERQRSLWAKTVTEVIEEANRQYEVVVKHSDFLDYLRGHNLEEKVTTTNVGARRKEGWRELCSYMAAYFAAHQRDCGGEDLKIDQLKTAIIEMAKKDQVPDLPREDTIKDQIAKAVNLIKRPDFKLKK